MSRTYRRKNAWNKKQRVSEFLNTADERFDTRLCRFNLFFRPHYVARFETMTEKEVVNHTHAKFHSESWLDDDIIENWYKQGWNKFLRNKGKQQLREALKLGEEEDLLPVSKKEITWWYDWAYFY